MNRSKSGTLPANSGQYVAGERRLRSGIHRRLSAIAKTLPSGFLLNTHVPAFVERVDAALGAVSRIYERQQLYRSFILLVEFVDADTKKTNAEARMQISKGDGTQRMIKLSEQIYRRLSASRVQRAFYVWQQAYRKVNLQEQDLAARKIQQRWRNQPRVAARSLGTVPAPGDKTRVVRFLRIQCILAFYLGKSALHLYAHNLEVQLLEVKAVIRIQSFARVIISRKEFKRLVLQRQAVEEIFHAASKIQSLVRARISLRRYALLRSRSSKLVTRKKEQILDDILRRIQQACAIQKGFRSFEHRRKQREVFRTRRVSNRFIRLSRRYLLYNLRCVSTACYPFLQQAMLDKHEASARKIQDLFRRYKRRQMFLLHRAQWEAQLHAAKRIQRVWRKKLLLKSKERERLAREKLEYMSSRRIQSVWRQRQAMQLLGAMKVKRRVAAIRIQQTTKRFLYRLRCYREGEELLLRKDYSAQLIQEFFRCYHEKLMRHRNKQAVVIQCSYRCLKSRDTLALLKAEHERKELERVRGEAALKVQCLIRQSQAQREIVRRKRLHSCILIQTNWRGYCSRQVSRTALWRLNKHNNRIRSTIQYDIVVRVTIARRLQANWRRKVAVTMKQSLKAKRVNEAAVLIQSLRRKYMARSHVNRAKSAKRIQESWRKASKRRRLADSLEQRLRCKRQKNASAIRLQAFWRSRRAQKAYLTNAKLVAKSHQLQLYQLERQRLAGFEEEKDKKTHETLNNKTKRMMFARQKVRENVTNRFAAEADTYQSKGWAYKLPDVELLDWEIRKASVRAAWEIRRSNNGGTFYYNNVLHISQVQQPEDFEEEDTVVTPFKEYPEVEDWIPCFRCSSALPPLLDDNDSLVPGCVKAVVYCSSCEYPFCEGCYDDIHARDERCNHPKLYLAELNAVRCTLCRLNLPSKDCHDCFTSYCSECFARTHGISESERHKTSPIKYADLPKLSDDEKICAYCELVTASSYCMDCDDNFCDACFRMVHRSRHRKRHIKTPYDKIKHWREMYDKETLTPYYKNIYTNEIVSEKPDVFTLQNSRIANKEMVQILQQKGSLEKRRAKLQRKLEELQLWKSRAEELEISETTEKDAPGKELGSTQGSADRSQAPAVSHPRVKNTGSLRDIKPKVMQKPSKWQLLANNPGMILNKSDAQLSKQKKHETNVANKSNELTRSKWTMLANRRSSVVQQAQRSSLSNPRTPTKRKKSEKKGEGEERQSLWSVIASNPGLVAKQGGRPSTSPAPKKSHSVGAKTPREKTSSIWAMLANNPNLVLKQASNSTATHSTASNSSKVSSNMSKPEKGYKWKFAKSPSVILQQNSRRSFQSTKKASANKISDNESDKGLQRPSKWQMLAENPTAIVNQAKRPSRLSKPKLIVGHDQPSFQPRKSSSKWKLLADNPGLVLRQPRRLSTVKFSGKNFLDEKSFIEKMLQPGQEDEQAKSVQEKQAESYKQSLMNEMSAIRKQKQMEHVEDAMVKILPAEFKRKYDRLFSKYSKAQNQVELSERCQKAGIKYGAAFATDPDKLTKEEALKELVMVEHSHEVSKKRRLQEQKEMALGGKELQRRLDELEKLSAPQQGRRSKIALFG